MRAANVVVALSGAVYVAPLGSPGPTGATTPLSPAWKSLGYLSSDGVGEQNTNDTTDIVGWQASSVVRRAVIKRQVTYEFTSLETNLTVLGLFYGAVPSSGDVSLTDFYEADYTEMYGQYAQQARRALVGVGDVYEANYTANYGQRESSGAQVISGGQTVTVALVIDVVDGPVVIRRYAPQAVVTPNGDVAFSANRAIDYPLSCTCLPDPGIDGSVTVYYNRLLSR